MAWNWAWIWLAVAIATEVAGTSAMKAADGMTRLWPSLIVVVAYGASLWALSIALRDIPVGVAYAAWSGLGIVGIATIGRVLYGQVLDPPALIGIGLILAGVLVINLFSTGAGH
ncbi:MAG: multidrug efflux SMR transporter [Pseudomonadota bacterium]